MRTTFRRESLPKAFTYSPKAYHSKKGSKAQHIRPLGQNIGGVFK
jgi:hypothetical protein